MVNVKSMTGYGKGDKTVGSKNIVVEIRSLNGKGLDLSVRMPSIYKSREMEIRNIISKALVRGKIEVNIYYEMENATTSSPINRAAFKNYYKQLSSISEELGFDVNSGDICSTILRLPDVMQSEREDLTDKEWDALFESVEIAVVNIDNFRIQEGNVLMNDILTRLSVIESCKTEIIPFEIERVEIIKNRIRENIENLGVIIDNNRLEQEMIYYIEKLDITEEKVRLQNHIDYFREVCTTEQAPGKKLGFITQEIGREINTTGSKANNTEIQKIVVRMKDELEKIKEQSLNLL